MVDIVKISTDFLENVDWEEVKQLNKLLHRYGDYVLMGYTKDFAKLVCLYDEYNGLNILNNEYKRIN